MPNETVITLASTNDRYNTITGTGEYGWGNDSGTNFNGALRFTNVPLTQGQSINRAGLYHFNNNISGSGTIRGFTHGIKETNTSNFSGGSPMGRPLTSTKIDLTQSGSASSWDIDVTSIVTEIIGQAGWSSGNAMGFVFINNGSDFDSHAIDTGALDILLSIRVTNPNLTPTPTTVAAPTFPALDDYGIKVSKPGFDVKTATEKQLNYWSRKKHLKILAEGEVSTTAGVVYQIAHGLAYIPQAIGFVRANGYSFQLPRIIGPATDPVGGGVQGELRVNSTHLRLYTTKNATVYYYLFLDEQST